MKHRSQGYLILLFWLAYTCAYLGRYSYNVSITLVEEAYKVAHADAGLVSSFFFFAYGIGQVLNGFLCKYYPRRYMMPIVLFVSSGINLLVALDIPTFGAIKYLWMVNGLAQSCLWPSLIYLVSCYIDSTNIKKAVLVMSTTAPVGTLIAYGMAALFANFFHDFRLSFLLGSVATAAVGVLWLITFVPGAEVTASAKPDEQPGAPSSSFSGRGLLYLLIGVLAIFAAIDNLVKDGLQTWIPAILKQDYGLDDSLSILLTLVLPLLGVFGAMFAVALKKKINNFVILCAVLFGMAGICIGAILATKSVPFFDTWSIGGFNPTFLLVLLTFGIVEFVMHAANNVITSMAPLYMREKVNAGRLAGILNGCCYVGSTISSYGLGKIADGPGGWLSVFWLLFGCVAVITLVGGGVALATRKSHVFD